MFVHVKCQAIGVNEDSVIDAAKEGLLHGLLRRKLTRHCPGSISELMRKLKEYARAEDDELRGVRGRKAGQPKTQRKKTESCLQDPRSERS